MKAQTLQQIRGTVVLMNEAVDASVSAINVVHQELAHQPYALLAQIEPIAAPVQAIEQVQQTITNGVYQAIRDVNRLVGAALTATLDRFEA